MRRRKPVFELLYEDARRKQARVENQVYVKQVETILLRGSGSTKIHEKLFGSSKLLQQKLKAQKEEYERIASLETPFKPRTTQYLCLEEIDPEMFGVLPSDRFERLY